MTSLRGQGTDQDGHERTMMITGDIDDTPIISSRRPATACGPVGLPARVGLPLIDTPHGPVVANGVGWMSCLVIQRPDFGGDHGDFVGRLPTCASTTRRSLTRLSRAASYVRSCRSPATSSPRPRRRGESRTGTTTWLSDRPPAHAVRFAEPARWVERSTGDRGRNLRLRRRPGGFRANQQRGARLANHPGPLRSRITVF